MPSLLFTFSTNSLPSLFNHLRRRLKETLSITISGGLGSSLYRLGADPTENTVSLQFRYCYRGVFTSPLHINGSSIVACVFISVGTYLPNRCLAMNYSGYQASCHSIKWAIHMYGHDDPRKSHRRHTRTGTLFRPS
jgi:hypothetical protein